MIQSLFGLISTINTGLTFIATYWLPIVIGLGATVGLAYLAFLWRNRYLALAAAGVALFGFGLISAYATGYQAHAAKTEKEAREEQARVMQLIIDGKQDAINELNAEQERLKARDAELNQLIEDIRNAPKKDNGTIAPVLDRTLKRLDPNRVRKPANPQNKIRKH